MARLNWRHYSAVALLTFLIFLPGRMTLPPLDRDEPRYMEASAQMLETENFIDVKFLDQKRYLQPAGIYWLEAGAEAVFGGPAARHVAWPYRIPSLIAATGAVTLTAWLGSLLFGAMTGLVAAAFLAVSTLMTAEGRMATIDTVLLFDILLVQGALLKTYLEFQQGRVAPFKWALLFWLALGCGLMLKGPVVLIPSFGTIGALWLCERRREWWRGLRFKFGWVIALAVVLPWCIAIGFVSDGAFFHDAVGVNFLGKIGQGQQAHGLPMGYHLAVFLLAFWPGSFFAVLALPQIWARRHEMAVRHLLCWIIPHWLVFEIIATKLPHYVLPTYPAIAILASAGIMAWAPAVPRHLVGRWLIRLYGALWSIIGLALAVSGGVLVWRDQHFVHPLLIFSAVLACVSLGACGVALLQARRRVAAMGAVLSAVLIHLGLFLIVIPKLSTIQLAPHAAALFKAHRICGDQTTLISPSYSEPSLAFLVGTQTKLFGVGAAATYMAWRPQCTLVLLDLKAEGLFKAVLGDQQDDLELLGRVSGLNYSNGHKLDLGLWRLKAAP